MTNPYDIKVTSTNYIDFIYKAKSHTVVIELPDPWGPMTFSVDATAPAMTINSNTGVLLYYGLNYVNIDYEGKPGQTCKSITAESSQAAYKKAFSDRGCTIYDAS
jgi:hypothetical protein